MTHVRDDEHKGKENKEGQENFAETALQENRWNVFVYCIKSDSDGWSQSKKDDTILVNRKSFVHIISSFLVLKIRLIVRYKSFL